MNYFKFIFSKTSLLRTFQFDSFKKVKIFGEVIEFGAKIPINQNFLAQKLNHCKPYYSNLNLYDKNFIKIDLQKKIKSKKKYDFVLLFNVLEHLPDPDKAIRNLSKILKRKGKIIGSTPFLFRVHGAPNDYYRFTYKKINEMLLENDFTKISIKELGTGPFLASISLLKSYLKFIPLIFPLLVTLSIILDKILNIFMKTKPNKIYPIGYFFIANKKK